MCKSPRAAVLGVRLMDAIFKGDFIVCAPESFARTDLYRRSDKLRTFEGFVMMKVRADIHVRIPLPVHTVGETLDDI